MSDSTKETAASRDSEPFLVLATTAPAIRPFWRRWLAGILVLGLAAGGALGMQLGLFPSLSSPHKSAPAGAGSASTNGTSAGTPAANSAGSPTGEAGLAENLAGLALQGISLFNGEKGAELWRLKATWAHLSQEGDTILVDAPVVRYTMGDPAANDFLDVKSEKGKVTDSQRYLTLTGNVDVKRFGDTVTGPRLDYDSKTRIMVFPEGATLDSERATGKAKVFTWNLETNIMVGEGGVNVLLKARPAPETPDAGAVSGTGTVNPAAPVVASPAGTAPKAVAAPKAATDKKAAARKTTTQKTTAKSTTKKTTVKSSTKKQSTKPTTPSSQKAPPKKSATPAKSAS